jgi:hypothetical protein
MKTKRTIGTVTMLVAMCGLSSVVSAHHLRGIPHYSYKNNYPETPVYEVVQTTDNWIVTFTYYKIPGQQALDLAIYIRDSLSNEPFADPVVFKVFGQHEDPAETHSLTAYRNPTNVYKVGWVYEDDGIYYVRVTFDDAVKTQNILFELNVGGENRVWYLLGGSVTIVVSMAAVVGIVRKRKKPGRRMVS